MQRRNKHSGFSLIELLVVLAILAILGGMVAPGLKSWMLRYRLKSAAMDLYSNMQLAKISAVKENSRWIINFNSSGTYDVIRCITATCNDPGGTEPNDYQISKSVNFATDYSGDIRYGHPLSSSPFGVNPMIFLATGLTLPPPIAADGTGNGYVYISNNINSNYYRVGYDSAAAAIRIHKWNGTGWE